MKPNHSSSAPAVPAPVGVGLAVLLVGLGAAAAALGGFGHAAGCGTFGMTCIGSAFAIALGTLCVAVVLLLWGLRSMPGGGRGRWQWAVKALVVGIAAFAGIAALVLGGFAVLVLAR